MHTYKLFAPWFLRFVKHNDVCPEGTKKAKEKNKKKHFAQLFLDTLKKRPPEFCEKIWKYSIKMAPQYVHD